MDVLPFDEEHKQGLVKLLISYWKSRGMDYSPGWTSRYVEEGHRTEILEDRFFVAVEAGEVVGSMSVILWEGRRAEMRDFYVNPKLRGKGVGERLLKRVLDFCKEKRVGKVFAFILPEVEEFFLKRGFVREGFLKGQCKKGEDLIAVGMFL